MTKEATCSFLISSGTGSRNDSPARTTAYSAQVPHGYSGPLRAVQTTLHLRTGSVHNADAFKSDGSRKLRLDARIVSPHIQQVRWVDRARQNTW
jgi:hypothetical protein